MGLVAAQLSIPPQAESSNKYGKYVVANDTEVGVTDQGSGNTTFTATKKYEVRAQPPRYPTIHLE